MDYPSQLYTNAHDTYYLPPRTVPLKVKQSKAWKKSMMDAFEHIAIEQFKENLQFVDYYRMYEGKMSFQELSEAVPHLDGLQDLLDGVGIPSFLRHYDILGVIVNALVGQYLTFREKYHVTDTGEVAQNEYLRYKDEQAQKLLTAVIENTVKMGLAKSGFDPDSNQKFESPEEQQAYMMKLQQMEESLIPKDTMRAKSSSFKSLGVQWGEATLDHDKIRCDFNSLEKEEFKHYLLSGRPVRHYHITKDSYKPETWDSKAVFTSKEIAGKQVQKGEFAGRLHFFTPSEVVGRWPHLIDSKTQKQLMGGNRQWKTHIHDGFANGSINDAVKNNFNKQVRVPFSNFFDYRTSLALQDDLDIPMGIQTIFNDDGTTTERNRYLPRLQGDYHGRYTGYARILRDDFSHRRDLCQVTEVYFRAYDLWGYFTYVNEEGMVVTEEVTEEILPEFIKENNIKQKYNQRLVDIVEDFKPGEIQWIYRPYTYEGVKIQSENLEEPLYLKVQKCEHQIFGDDEWETILPVAGLVGKPIAAKIEPYQSKYNLCMNQIFQLLEKELGMFFLMSTEMTSDDE